ncbi:MAG: hypothetical protein GY854_15355, partial [Deltaproteobacteria bacterium]|nr:hypothetical protein [Deltaproteobacteria bacterium]
VTNCTFESNSAEDGGGICNSSNSSPIVNHCVFQSNSADETGGGLRNSSNSSPVVTSCVFKDNSSVSQGGGMYNTSNSSPTVTNCIFESNSAEYCGGMTNRENSSPTVTNCTFQGNSGGGMINSMYSSPIVTNCTFEGNSTSNDGGGMANFAASSPTVTNCTFRGNSSDENGGGMHSNYSKPIVTNCTFKDNSATLEGGGMYNDYVTIAVVANCIFWDNSAPQGPQIQNYFVASMHPDNARAVVLYSDVQGGCTTTPPFSDCGPGIIDTDPLFASGSLRLTADSPCIDKGSAEIPWRDGIPLPSGVPWFIRDVPDLDRDGDTSEPIPLDKRYLQRVMGAELDMGAHEYGVEVLFALGYGNQVEVVFSEDMDQTSAETRANYSIDQEITVNSAMLGSEPHTVLLSTSSLTDCNEYGVTVNNVTSDKGYSVVPDATAQFIAGDTLLVDTFDSDGGVLEFLDGGVEESVTGWKKYDQTTVGGTSNWIEENGRMNQYAETQSPSGDALNRLGTYAFWNDVGVGGWTDYALLVSIWNTDNDGMGVMFRYQDDENYYKLELDWEDQFRRLVKKVGGVNTELALETDLRGFYLWEESRLEVQIKGNQITAYLNDSVLFGGPVVDDTPLTSGTVTLYSFGNSGVSFDNLRVSSVCE